MALKSFIIHVSSAVERRKAIEKELADKDFDLVFVLDGDIASLTPSRLSTFFSSEMQKPVASTSCAFKHILVYQEMLRDNIPLALVLEDDIRFYSNVKLLSNIRDEITNRALHKCIISLEDSRLKYIPKSMRTKGTLLYKEKSGRMTGAYLIDYAAAKSILEYIEIEKVNRPIDWFHNQCITNNVIDMYWAQPPIAVQGSCSGSMTSLIGKGQTGIFKVLSFKFERIYKRLLYFLR